MDARVIEQVERYLTQELSFPPAMFSVSHLAALDLKQTRIALASPKHMSRGGDLPFVICGDRVMPGNLAALEGIVRAEGLDTPGGLTIERFVELFFLLVVVGRGGPVAPPQVARLGDRIEIHAVTGDGIDREPVTHRIVIDHDGHIEWNEA